MSLLAMADLYLMEDLKDAVGPLIAWQTTKDNILEISQMAEKYSAPKLKEMCCNFILQNLNTLDKQTLIELNKALPLVGEKALLHLREGSPMDRSAHPSIHPHLAPRRRW